MTAPPDPPPVTGPPVTPFGTRLATAAATHGALCVGIDPHPGLLLSWGLPDSVDGLAAFSAIAVEALGGHVAVLKPQVAFYERFGSRGIAVLETTVAAARATGSLVISDAKRGDIGSTVEAYAAAWLEPASPLYADAVTASPYLGVGALAPMFAAARRAGAGVFVLALTSNPEGAAVQRARTTAGPSVARTVITEVAAADDGTASLGVVVGATIADLEADLDGFAGPILAPGLGAQGGTVADLRRLADVVAGIVVPSTSRDVARSGPDPKALRAAALRCRDELAEVGL